MDHAIGISLDGVLLFPNLDYISDSKYVDQWTPSNLSIDDNYTAGQLDSCLGSISEIGEYNYKSASNCITARVKSAT